jgi:hypothetical protein
MPEEPVQPIRIDDVARPNTTKVGANSKPIIVSNRPRFIDPMMINRSKNMQLSAKPEEKLNEVSHSGPLVNEVPILPNELGPSNKTKPSLLQAVALSLCLIAISAIVILVLET